MFLVPLTIRDSQEYDLFVVMEHDNILRIMDSDPVEILTSTLLQFADMKMKSVSISYLEPRETVLFLKFVREGKPLEALKLTHKNFQFRPEQGDHDGPAVSLKTENDGPVN